MRILGLALLLASATSPSQTSKPADESPHVAGPNGLEGWTLNYEIPDQGTLPMTLVLARRGHVIRRIDGEPFIWKWIFQSNGEQVAYEAGPLHFSMECVLVEISSGKRIDDYDCYSKPLAKAPNWVKALESRPQ